MMLLVASARWGTWAAAGETGAAPEPVVSVVTTDAVVVPAEKVDLTPEAPAKEPATPAPERPARAEKPTATGDWCSGDDSGNIGYWYAGPTPPGKAGETIVAPRSANVRADYPHSGNHFNKRARVRCSVTIGDRLRLSHEPIRVYGGHFWVPLYVGDRVEDGEKPGPEGA
jgi:hypothetical protein